ncbi:MAG: hypothetical protein WCH01_20365, partial [Methylococcaceae bacterium]
SYAGITIDSGASVTVNSNGFPTSTPKITNNGTLTGTSGDWNLYYGVENNVGATWTATSGITSTSAAPFVINGTFNHNNGTISYSPNIATSNFDPKGTTFYNLTLSGMTLSGSKFYLLSDFDVAGNLSALASGVNDEKRSTTHRN